MQAQRSASCAALALCLCATGACGASASDGQDPAADGGRASADATPLIDSSLGEQDPGTLLWRHEHKFVTRKAPALVNGVLYYQGQRTGYTPVEYDTMVAIADRDTYAEKLWGAKTDSGSVPAPSISVYDSVVYAPVVVNNGSGQEFTSDVIRFDLDGQELGRTTVLGPLRLGISFGDDGSYYTPVIDLHAHKADTSMWNAPVVMDDTGGGNAARTGSNTAVDSEGTIFVGSRATDKNLYAIHSDGTVKWRVKWGVSGIDQDPKGFVDAIATHGGLVYAANTSRVLRAINNDASGSTQWSFTSDLGVQGIAVSSEGTAYFGTGGLGISSVKAVRDGGSGSGELLWERPMPSVVDGTPALSEGGSVYVAACNTFYALSATTGDVQWTHEAASEGVCLTWSAATIGPNGRVYVSTYDVSNPDNQGVLLAFEGDRTGPEQDAWSSDGGNNANTGRIEVQPDIN